MPGGQPKTGGSWWRGLTERGPLEKGMASHFSILALRTPWTVWKKQSHWIPNSSSRDIDNNLMQLYLWVVLQKPGPRGETCWPQPRWQKQVGARRMMIRMTDITLLIKTPSIRRLHELITHLRYLPLFLTLKIACLKTREFRSFNYLLHILWLDTLQINAVLSFTTTVYQ